MHQVAIYGYGLNADTIINTILIFFKMAACIASGMDPYEAFPSITFKKLVAMDVGTVE